MFYQYNLEYVAGIFSDSEEERLNELAKVKYTYEHLRSSKADQLYSEDKEINKIIDSKLNIKLNATEEEILNLINREKYITQLELAKLMALSESCIYKNLKNLKAKGIIERVGSNKNGYWKILI